MQACLYHPTSVGVRRKLVAVGFFLPPCGDWALSSGCHAWWQMPLPAEASLWPFVVIFKMK